MDRRSAHCHLDAWVRSELVNPVINDRFTQASETWFTIFADTGSSDR
jgi:hypothetical protein